MNVVKTLTCVIFCEFILGCQPANHYVPLDIDNGKRYGVGYHETLQPSGEYILLAVGFSEEKSRLLWHRRATELCGGDHYENNIFRAEGPTNYYGSYASYGGASGYFLLEGILTCSVESAEK